MTAAPEVKSRATWTIEQRLRALLRAAAVGLGAVQAWTDRYAMDPDGISYLDIADAYLRGDWGAAVNAQWSPLYCWLIMPAMAAARGAPAMEFPAVHVANFIIYAVALVCFEFFLRQLTEYRRRLQRHAIGDSLQPLPDWAWTTLGYSLFAWSSLALVKVGGVHPDMLVSAFVYLASGMLLRIRAGHDGRLAFALLGVALGFGYLAKAPMFPLAFIFLGASLFAAGGLRRALPRALVGLAIFLAVAGPFIFAISQAKGRATFGDSGKLNYAWNINGVTRFIHWQGEGEGYGTPAHPTRKIFDEPAVYEFAAPIESTYPPWYDPSYWYEGVRPRFDLKGQARVLLSSLEMWWHLLFNLQRGLVILLLVLFLTAGRSGLRLQNMAAQAYLIVPAIAAFAMFSLVNLEARYVAPFVVLAWLALLASVRLPRSSESKRLVRSVTIAMVIVLTIATLPPVFKGTVKSGDAPIQAHLQVARALADMGLQPGDRVASVGDSFRAYWARLARVRIVAEVASRGTYEEIPAGAAERFWEAPDALRDEAVAAIASTGAAAIVSDQVPRADRAAGWRKIDGTRYYLYPLRPIGGLSSQANP